MTTPAELGLDTPGLNDLLREGAENITTNAEVLAQIYDEVRWWNVTAITSSANIYGLPRGRYRIASTAVAEALNLPSPSGGYLLMLQGPGGAGGILEWRPNVREAPPEIHVAHQLLEGWTPFVKITPHHLGTMDNGTDLDNLVTPGIHDSPSTVGGITSILNRPPGGYTDGGIYRQFSVEVRTVGGVVFQRAYAWLDGNTMQVFRRTSNGDGFSPWRTVQDDMAEPVIRSLVGTPARTGNLDKLRAGILNPGQRTVVVAVGVSHFRTQGGGRINVIERLAYQAGSPTVPNLDPLAARPGAGMQWVNGAVGGSESADYLPEARCLKIDLAEPDYVIHGIGANDYSRNVTPGAFKVRVRNRLVRIETGTPGVCNVLVHLQNRSDASSPAYPWSDYGDALRELAAEHPDRVFIDANAPIDSFMLHERNSAFGLQLPDNIHLTDNGVKVLAQIMGDALGIPAVPDVTSELREAIFPTTATYTADTDLAEVQLRAVRYPRIVTVRARAGYTLTGTGSARFTAGPAGTAIAEHLVNGGHDATAKVTHDYYLPPGQAATYTAALDITGTAEVSISGDPGESVLQVTDRPY